MLRLGIIGYGAIAHHLLAAAAEGQLPGVAIAAILVRRPRAEPGQSAALLTHEPDRFFAAKPDAVLECAGHAAVREHGERALREGADLLVTSVGAFADTALLDRMVDSAVAAKRRLILPSAGIGALDILAAAAVGGLEAVHVTVRKDALSWRGTEAETAHDLGRLAGAVTLHDGPVREGARRYPQNVNIAAATALAGIGLDRTRLTIIADPAIATHQVEIEASGRFGSFRFAEEVIPSEENPKTGRLVAMAVLKTVRQLRSPLVIGW